MDAETRKALYGMLSGLSNKLQQIADDTADIDTSDELNKLIEVIDASTDQLLQLM